MSIVLFTVLFKIPKVEEEMINSFPIYPLNINPYLFKEVETFYVY